MKRGRKSMDSIYLGPSFSDLPRDITVNFLLRLPVKRIFVCKIVCKIWNQIISEPNFAKLHFEQAQAFPLIQIGSHREWSRMLYLVQPEEDLEHKLDICDHSVYDSKCRCRVKFELDTKLKLPLPDRLMMFHDKSYNHRYWVVNSCNGLLCLSSSYNNEPLVVCNPVTGEFVHLPKAKNGLHLSGFWCGFGFSPASNQYKVVRVGWEMVGVRAEINTLGTKIWKDIDSSGYEVRGVGPTYLNGYLYWHDYARLPCLISLDIENECFLSISVPPLEDYYILQYSRLSLGVIGGELSVSCFLSSGETVVLVMKNVGATNVWSKVFSIQLDWHHKIRDFGSCQPIKYMNDGALLVLNLVRQCFIYIHPRRQRIRYFKLRGKYKGLKVFAHIPSFVSLKDALSMSGHNVEVLKSRFTELKPEDEDSIGLKEMYEVKHQRRGH